jgi:hypothetical protein
MAFVTEIASGFVAKIFEFLQTDKDEYQIEFQVDSFLSTA